MKIDEHFNFGKYEGFTLREVYQGTNQIDKVLVKDYIVDKILGEHKNTIDFPILNRIQKFELGDTLLRIESYEENDNFFWEDVLESILRNGNTWYDRIIGNLSLDNLSRLKGIENKEYSVFREGAPGYIEWCIANIDRFFISPEYMSELQSLEVLCFGGIEITHKIEDIYEYKPIITWKRNDFSKEIIEINNKKVRN